MSSDCSAAPRAWTSSAGITLTGELEAYDGKVARISIGGDAYNVPISSLSPADQKYLSSTFPNGKDPELLAKSSDKSKGGKGGKAMKADAAGKDDKAQIKVELVGLAVCKSTPNQGAAEEDALFSPGTHVRLWVSSEQNIIGLDNEKSKIATCTDNKNTDLTEGASGQMFTFEPAADGKGGLVSIHLPQTPTAKAVRASLKGELHLQTDLQDGEPVRLPLNLELLIGL